MTTHVDGAVPSVAPDPDDGNPDDGILDDGGSARHPSEFDDGSQWVRAEIQRRMAENRSTRGRHARRGEAAAGQPDGLGGREASQGRRRKPVAPARIPPPPPVPPPGSVAAGDLPENYVPRHSVLTPGPAAEPAAPISGPIPVVRPVADDGTTAEVPNTIETRSAPVGGPSLPPTGIPLPVRKRRTGPGVPLHGDGSAAGPWSRPGSSIVPDQPVQRLGAPPGVPGGSDSLPSWGVPASPPYGFAAAAAAPTEVTPRPDTGPAEIVDDAADTVDDVGVAAGAGLVQPADYTDYDDYDDDDDAYDDDEYDGDGDEYDDDGDGDGDGDTDDADDHDTGAVDTGAVDPAADTVDTAGTDLAEAATTVLPVIHTGTPPPARMVGIPVQRAPVHNRNVPPRPVTPRHIPVVGTAPPEPGSTRVRVVLSERKGVARPVRTIKEVQEGTAVGELLRRNLIRSQLMVTLRFAALTVFVLGTLPAVLTLLPEVGRFHLLGVRVPWLLLGLLMYPFLVGVAWRYTRVADRVEQNFADHVQD
ncbi:hypothetical protein [Pseudonocardia charpentierae]|uniref:DUF485 domain-containing protein n=1 Tax=Pseudonocardia charpentierae TaxID=3075545 RepID=A0ABU2N387_9PSEU|nr:hypothetical protein [Pseudonocardia sp. DSM 45834]MDT0348381.1 hypothetical protein [Pseudonocardia sp. DSM 45834]